MMKNLQILWQKASDSGPQQICTSSDTKYESVKLDVSHTHMHSQGSIPQ